MGFSTMKLGSAQDDKAVEGHESDRFFAISRILRMMHGVGLGGLVGGPSR